MDNEISIYTDSQLINELNKRKTFTDYRRISNKMTMYTPEYLAWMDMKSRCYDVRNKDFEFNGARGIKVCDRWLDSYENFFDDMGSKPTENHRMHRINNNDGYSPKNCKWGTIFEWSVNKKMMKNNTSGKTGVHWSKVRKLWGADISVKGKRIRLGFFNDYYEAVEVRKNAEIKHFGMLVE